MVVGIASIQLHMSGIHSLKEKRSVVKRVLERTRNSFPVSIAEVGFNDAHDRALIGFSVVSNDSRVAQSIMDKVVDFVEGLYLAEIYKVETELVHINPEIVS